MAVMILIQGTDTAYDMTGDRKQTLAQCKQIQREIHTYHLTNAGIVEGQLYWHMCGYYMSKGMSGSAHSALQAAVSCTQNHAPSAWTAGVCELQADMYDILAQVCPGHRKEHQNIALMCYTNAREHWLHQPCQEETLYTPLCYTMHMIHIKLDMPTLNTIIGFRAIDMVYQRLSECVVTHRHVTEAQDMLKTVTPHIHSLPAGRRPFMHERVLICGIFVNIRLTQLAIIDMEYKSGLKYITTGAKLFDDWCDYASRHTYIKFKGLPLQVRDTKKVLDKLHDHLVLIPSNRLAPQPELLSDSLSSEQSNAPPSGLKQLTDASWKAEKRALRDAYGFSYSSGDIHTDSQDDVSTE